MGAISTQIRYNDSSEQWVMTDAVSSVRAESRATKLSYVLGKHEWTVTNDIYSCSKGQPYTTLLKMSGCNPEGEFTCDDGQCVTMEQRCDQLSDCRDKSDEVGCQLLVLEKSYNKKVPPITSVSPSDRTIVPVPVNISIGLLKIVDMEETNHKIDFQFRITLEWKENRATFHNLKQDTSLNALSDDNLFELWLPNVIYDNTDQKELTRIGENWEWSTELGVVREGNFSRSGLDVVDETEYL